ncbi:PREDICTED: uncharacterized protein LOC108776770 [Cyphomyrmex costatus]|uniref:uncharacterized protein LOC108776770 n=1 Tax=Cyphomyrmex costatus TaxID=456900 RepID=UPI0008524039|nr:PREDICTED: uncharacterized protein LOC108776770 [Cyphomyrmex costatus]
MPSCCTFGCSNRVKNGLKIYMARFPSDPVRKKSWTLNVQKINGKDWEPTIHSFICEIHFTHEMWEKVRIDKKRKLKCNAIPVIFPQLKRSYTCTTTNDESNESLEKQPEAMLETFHNGNVNKEQHNCFKSNVPDVSPSTSNAQTLNLSPELSNSNYLSTSTQKEMYNKKFDEVQYLKKQLEEANRKIDSANKLLLKIYQSNNMLKKRIKRMTRNNFENRNYAKLESAIKQTFTDDQIKALIHPSLRICKWSNNTIRKALRLRISCGSTGYQQLLKEKIPLPTERTLRRRLENIEFEEGISKAIFKLLEDNKVAQFQDIGERDCIR